MSRLLLMRPVDGRVDVVLADEERDEGGLRVFVRGSDIVLCLPPGEPVVVRDIESRRESRRLCGLPKNLRQGTKADRS